MRLKRKFRVTYFKNQARLRGLRGGEACTILMGRDEEEKRRTTHQTEMELGEALDQWKKWLGESAFIDMDPDYS